jgi:hypothetical protein
MRGDYIMCGVLVADVRSRGGNGTLLKRGNDALLNNSSYSQVIAPLV